jgi:hypothetical protein
MTAPLVWSADLSIPHDDQRGLSLILVYDYAKDLIPDVS